MPNSADLSRLYGIISEAERLNGRQLTNAARQMLITPISEVLDFGYRVDWQLVESSIFLLVGSAEPDKFVYRGRLESNSRSVISAFASQFCKIPPFCGPAGERTR